jgi:hypothetical protein
MNEIRELHGVTHEEDRSIVANEVVVALFRIELEGESQSVSA